MSRILILSTVIAAFLLGTACDYVAAQHQSRIWTSRDGQQVEATFSGYDPGNKLVSLSLSNSTTLNVQLDRLSQVDRRHVLLVARKGKSIEKAGQQDNVDKRNTRRGRNRSRAAKQTRITGNRFGIDWTLGLEKALSSAEGRPGSNDDRPVMWMRVLGDLNGFM